MYRRSINMVSATMKALIKSTSGVTAVEYALLIGIMALGLAAGLGVLADVIDFMFNSINTNTQDALNRD